MPPKKRPRLSSSAASTTPQVDNSANTPASSDSAKPGTEHDLVTDPWTDEQETALLKGVIKWKPVGLLEPPYISLGVAAIHVGRALIYALCSFVTRHAQALPYDRYLGVHEEPRLCAVFCRAHPDSWDLEEATDSLQPLWSRRTCTAPTSTLAGDYAFVVPLVTPLILECWCFTGRLAHD